MEPMPNPYRTPAEPEKEFEVTKSSQWPRRIGDVVYYTIMPIMCATAGSLAARMYGWSWWSLGRFWMIILAVAAGVVAFPVIAKGRAIRRHVARWWAGERPEDDD